MSNPLRSLSFVILFAGLSVISVLGVIGLLNNVYADNANMSDNVGMNATVNASANTTGNMTGSTTGNMTGSTTGNMTMTNMPKMLSPLEQFKSGTSATSVKCNEGFTLVIKIEDGSPACVTSQIAQALIARGWGTAP